MSGRSLIAAAVLASVALVGAYAIAGGGCYEPTPVADPCDSRSWTQPVGAEEIARQFALSALDGAACELGVTREELAAGLATEGARESFAAEQGIEDAELEDAVRAGVVRAIADAEAAGELDQSVAAALAAVASRLPVDEAVAAIENGAELIDDAGGLIEQAGGLLDRAGELLP